MAAEYVIALLGLLGSLGAVVALLWAIRQRQIQTSDRAMYEAIVDDEQDYADSAQSSASTPKSARWLFAAALTLVFALVCWMIVQTVRIGTHTAQPPLERRLPSSE